MWIFLARVPIESRFSAVEFSKHCYGRRIGENGCPWEPIPSLRKKAQLARRGIFLIDQASDLHGNDVCLLGGLWSGKAGHHAGCKPELIA